MNNFINQQNIQDLAREQNDNSDDSVYELIKKDENEELTKFFDKIKLNFMIDIDNHLTSEYRLMNNNYYQLVTQIISHENGNEKYKKKIKNQISKIKKDEKLFCIKHLTILLTGKSGTGKSTLINVLLNEKAPTGVGTYITKDTTPYRNKIRPYLRLVDTRGIELSVHYGPEKVEKECKRFINSQFQSNEINNFVHCIWYCITGNKLEQSEILLLNSLRNTYHNSKIPIIIVYLQNTDDEIMKKMKKFIKFNNIEGDFIDILAKEKKTQGFTLKSYNLDKLVIKTIKKVREALNGDLRNVMITKISEHIQKELYEENRRIKNKINEMEILTLIEQDKVQKDEEFENTLINNVYGQNVRLFFKNKNLNKNTIIDIKNSNLIIFKNNYLKYTQKYEENIIKNELSTLAYQFLDIQAKKEKLKGKSTNPRNKRCHEDFINTNKAFLLNNLDYIAQKRYYNFIAANSCVQLNDAFEQSLNNTTSHLLNDEEIKELINKCFVYKYDQFEKKIEDFDSNIKIEPTKKYEDDDTNLISNFVYNNIKSNKNKYEQFEKKIGGFDSDIKIEPTQKYQDDDTNLISNFEYNNIQSNKNIQSKVISSPHSSEFEIDFNDLPSYTTKNI